MINDTTGSCDEEARILENTLLVDYFKAIVKEDITFVKRLLCAFPWLANVKHELGWYPIHAAVLTGNLAMVELFTSCGDLDVRVTDDFTNGGHSEGTDERRKHELSTKLSSKMRTQGATALHFACLSGIWEIIEAIIASGAYYDVKDRLERSPQEYFASCTDENTLKAFEDFRRSSWLRERSLSKKSVSRLCTSLQMNLVDDCKMILVFNASAASQMHPSGWYPIQVAVVTGQVELLDLLLQHLSLKDLDKHDISEGIKYRKDFCPTDNVAYRLVNTKPTALHYACMLGNGEMMKKLIEAGADWKECDRNDLTPLEYIDPERQDLVEELRQLCQREEASLRAAAQEETSTTEIQSPEGDKPKDEPGSSSESDNSGSEDSQAEDPKTSQPIYEENLDEDTRALRKFMRENPMEIAVASKIIGQKGPVRSVTSALQLRVNGWVDPNRPLVMLFLGSSGVGKTELAKQVTCYLQRDTAKTINDIENDNAFIRIDMSEYQHSHTVSNLTGPPKGYVGYDSGGILTGKLKKNPKAIVLLDEIEKAHPDVLTVFLQVFDDGRISDPKRGTIICKNAVFIMTSNLGSEEIREAAPELRRLVERTTGRHQEYLRHMGEFNRSIHPILKRRLRRDEFLGRINQIVVFLPLSQDEMSEVIEIELNKWRARAKEHHCIEMSWSQDAVDKLAEAYDVNYGVRSVINETQRIAVQLVAEAQIRGEIDRNWRVHLTLDDAGDVAIRKVDPTCADTHERRGCRYIV